MKWLTKLKNKKIILFLFGAVLLILIIFALLPAGYKKNISAGINKVIGNKNSSVGSSKNGTGQGNNQKNSGNNNKAGRDQTTTAQNLADGKMENLINLPYGSLATKNGSIYPQGDIPDSETVTGGGDTFNVHISITYGNNADSKIINIEVKDSSDKETLAESSKEVFVSGGITIPETQNNNNPRINP